MNQKKPFGFDSSLRLKKGWEFDTVFRTGRQVRGDLVRLCFVFTQEKSARIGVTVGKKIANSVKRARGRRLLRESVRRLIPWIRNDIWLVISLRQKGLKAGATEIYLDTADTMKRHGLLLPGWPGTEWTVDRK